MKLLAYHGKQEIKDKYVARMKAHIEADELVRGIGFEDGKGCAVGCTLNNYDHIIYKTALGFPMWIARIEDSLFEGMSLEKSKTFPLIFLETIQPGMVLESIKKSFLIYILEQALTTFDNEKFTDVRDSILRVITFYKTTFNTELETKEWTAARTAAWEVSKVAGAVGTTGATGTREAEAAAWAAACAVSGAAAKAAEAAVWAAAKAAESAVWAAGKARGAWAAWVAGAAAGVARTAAYDKYADKLIELIKQCTIER